MLTPARYDPFANNEGDATPDVNQNTFKNIMIQKTLENQR